MNDDQLIDSLVDTFGTFDDLYVSRDFVKRGEIEPLLIEPWSESGWANWRPIRDSVSKDALDPVNRNLPGPLPSLFVLLLRTYRWYEIDVGRIRLLSNLSPAPLSFCGEAAADRHLFEAISRVNSVQFGRGPDVDYDPVCFDLRSRGQDDDCRIVKFDHEEILCNDRIVEVGEVAPSFRALVQLAIDDAKVERTVRSLQGSELVRAAGRLAELTDAERGYLVQAFGREVDVANRQRAIAIVRQTTAPLTVPLLAAGLRDPDPAVWADALEALFCMAPLELRPLLRDVRAQEIGYAETYGDSKVREIVGAAFADRAVASSAAKVQAIDAALRKLGDSA